MVSGHFDLRFGFLAKSDAGDRSSGLNRSLVGEMHLFFPLLPKDTSFLHVLGFPWSFLLDLDASLAEELGCGNTVPEALRCFPLVVLAFPWCSFGFPPGGRAALKKH